MKIKLLVSIGFITHVLVGSFCMMPMAMAASMPIHDDEAMEMVMTPMEPMSPAHCEHCAHLTKENPTPMSTGCAGHCLSKSNDVGVAMVQNAAQTFLVAALPPSFINTAYADAQNSFVEANAPPTAVSPTRTIVLLE